MRKVFVLLFLIISIPRVLFAQYYIKLDKSNTFHYKNSYLIDIPLKNNAANLFIQDPQRLVPLKAYPGLDTIFISNGIQTGKKGLQRKTLKNTSVFFYNHQHYTFDTLKNIDNRFTSYKQILQWRTTIKKDSLLIYYIEGDGLMGFDTIYSRHPLNNFIIAFEKKYHVKIGDIFYMNNNDVGIGDAYLTLSGLTSTQKMQFINERDFSLNSKEMSPKVYYPILVPSSHLHPTSIAKTKAELQKEQDEIVYNAVDIEPKPTEGMAAFLALFKKINLGDSGILYVAFIVKKDGSLSDYKVLRGGNEQTDKKVYEILKNSPKWNPGILNNKNVNVQYTVRVDNNTH